MQPTGRRSRRGSRRGRTWPSPCGPIGRSSGATRAPPPTSTPTCATRSGSSPRPPNSSAFSQPVAVPLLAILHVIPDSAHLGRDVHRGSEQGRCARGPDSHGILLRPMPDDPDCTRRAARRPGPCHRPGQVGGEHCVTRAQCSPGTPSPDARPGGARRESAGHRLVLPMWHDGSPNHDIVATPGRGLVLYAVALLHALDGIFSGTSLPDFTRSARSAQAEQS
jgi:hypothetical protein